MILNGILTMLSCKNKSLLSMMHFPDASSVPAPTTPLLTKRHRLFQTYHPTSQWAAAFFRSSPLFIKRHRTFTSTHPNFLMTPNSPSHYVGPLVRLLPPHTTFTLRGTVRSPAPQTFTLCGTVRSPAPQAFMLRGTIRSPAPQTFTLRGIVLCRLSFTPRRPQFFNTQVSPDLPVLLNIFIATFGVPLLYFSPKSKFLFLSKK